MYVYMKKISRPGLWGMFLVLVAVLLLVFPAHAWAQVQPEDVPIIANDMAMNSTISNQNITGGDNLHWYKVTTDEAGKLTLTLKGNVNTSGWLRLYDVNGYVELKRTEVKGIVPGVIECGLYPGTYFVKVERSGNDWVYNLTNQLTVPTLEQYQEPNDLLEHAQKMELNSTAKAHLGYQRDGYVDNVDWWKVTTDTDGLLQVNIKPTTGAKGTLKLYDVNGSAELDNAKFGYNEDAATASVEYNLMQGTYYIKVELGEGFYEYSLTNSLIEALYDNDPEPNDTFTHAQPLALNGTATGHLGYRYYSSDDNEDWWKITTAQDGSVKVNIQGTGDTKGKLTVYNTYMEKQQTIDLGVKDNPVSGSVECKLRAGTCYLQVERTDNSVWSYTLANSFTAQEVEKHPGAGAKVLPLNGSNSGKISKENPMDWWKVTTNADGLLKINFEADIDPGCVTTVYDQNGIKVLATTYYTSGPFGVEHSALDYSKEWEFSKNFRPGTYYVKVERFRDRDFSYTLSSSLTEATWANDPEPNDVKEVSGILPLGGSVTGHIGYYCDNQYDTVDWWKVTTDADGLLKINFEADIDPGCFVTVYDQNGINGLATTYYNSGPFSNPQSELDDSKEWEFSKNFRPGTYYVKVERFRDRDFSYTLSSSFTKAPLKNDPEPNDVKEVSGILPLGGSVTGHIGYYRDGQYDTVDWWKVATNAEGLLKINFEADIDPGCFLVLYDENGIKELITTRYNLGPFSNPQSELDDSKECEFSEKLRPGTYYVKVERFRDRDFSYTLSSSFTKAPLKNDPEPNFHYTNASTLILGQAVTGHIGYYSNYFRDDQDWWKVHVPQTGTLTVNMLPNSEAGCFINIYGPDGTTRLSRAGTGDNHLWPTSLEARDLQPGDYYIQVERSWNRIFSYYLTASLTTENQTGPAVKSVYPGNQATVTRDFENIGLPIMATFNKKMEEKSITSTGAFTLLDSNNRSISATVKYSGTIATLIPDFPLENGSYTAIISGGVEDKPGNPMGSDYSWTFTVVDYEEEPPGIPVIAVTLDKNTLTMTQGKTEQLTARIYPPDADNQGLSWHSDSTGVAMVDQNGLITAMAPGTATITVTSADGGKSDTCTVTVTSASTPGTPSPPVASNVIITGDYTVGSTLTGSYDYYDADGDEEYGSSYQWLISDEASGFYTFIPGATSKHYTVQAADAGKHIKFEVTPRASQAPQTGVAAISAPVYISPDTGGEPGGDGDYQEWAPPENQYGADKTWTIVLSEMIDRTSLTGAVYVEDAQGQVLDQIIMLADFKPVIAILPPPNGYTDGKYTLYVEKTLRSVKGIALKQPVKMPFTIAAPPLNE